MKRLIVVLSAIFLVLCLLSGAQAQSAPAQRKMTILVYMCGSNLESTSGAASADIQEMLEATETDDDLCLLIMTGGTQRNAGDFSSRNTRIVEIRKGRKRTILDSDLMNMGSGESLSWFIQYGMDNRPAEKYALILWDHGGGPLEGVCWDEMFSMDHLNLNELTGALAYVGLDQKFSWIGFDACLMSSMEVASAISPYAEYMIASQETEPSFGWNYSFLRGITQDLDGAETGRRIVDAFFDGHEDSHETLTLACTDLSRIRLASEALGAYFATLTGEMSEEDYVRFAENRNQAVGFGDSVRGLSDDNGYDLVDALDLLHLMGNPDDSVVINAVDQLKKAIVYSRSNLEGAGGLSLYFPYYNKGKYLDSWRASYETLGFDWYYRQYIQSFASVLSGDRMIEWKHLTPKYEGKNGEGDHVISLQLTEEQREHLASAQLLILHPGAFGSLKDSCELVAVTNAEVGTDNCLTATYDNRMLYIETGDGNRNGPISFFQTRDGRFNVIDMTYEAMDIIEVEKDPNSTEITSNLDFVFHTVNIHHFLDADDKSAKPEIQQTQVWDDTTQTFTNRLAFSPDGYETMKAWSLLRNMPRDSEGVLPPIGTWTVTDELISYHEMLLPCDWHYCFSDEYQAGEQLYAVFQITDIQQNQYCSLPVAIVNSDRTPMQIVSGSWSSDLEQAVLTGDVIRTKEAMGIQLVLDITNLDTQEKKYQVSEIELNGNRIVPGRVGLISMRIPGGEHHSIRLDIPLQDLAGLNEIHSIAIHFKAKEGGEERMGTAEFEVSGCDISDLTGQPFLAEMEHDNVRVSLLSVKPDEKGGLQIVAALDNGTEEICNIETIAVNGISLDLIRTEKVEPGYSRVLEFGWDNDVHMWGDEFPIRGKADSKTLTPIPLESDILQALGNSQVQSISISYYMGDKRNLVSKKANAVLTLTESLALPEQSTDSERITPELLAQNNEYKLELRRVVIGDEGIAAVMALTNTTDHFLDVAIRMLSMDGTDREGYYVQPNTTLVFCMTLNRLNGIRTDQKVQSIEFQPKSADQPSVEPAVAELMEPAQMGENGGIWISPDHIRITPAVEPDAEWAAPKGMEDAIILPENAESYRLWLDVPLTSEELAVSKGSKVYILKQWEDGKIQLISIQAQVRNEEGRLGCFHPGLVLCPESQPDMLLSCYIEESETGMLQLTGIGNWSVQGGNRVIAKSESYSDILISLDFLQNTSSILSYNTTIVTEPFESQSEMESFHAPFISTTKEIGDNGQLKPFEDWGIKSYVMSISISPKPVQLVFRPVTPEDNLWIMFSIMGPDGNAYGILTPWPAE